MKITIILITLLSMTAASGSATVAVANPAPDQARESATERAEIVLDRTTHDFGRIRYGEIVSTTFSFRNDGLKTLKLYPVPEEKSRLQVRTSSESVEPGGSGQIEVTLDTNTLYGTVTDSISFFTNDRDHREIFLKVTGRVLAIVAAAQPYFNVGDVEKGESYSGSIPLVGMLIEDGDISGVSLEVSSPHVQAKITENSTGDSLEAILEFTLQPEMKAGNIEETIAIVSSDPPARAFFRLFGRKWGDIHVTPTRLMMIRQEGEEEGEHVLVVESDRPFHITRIEDLTNHLDLSTRTIVPDSKYEVVARTKNLEEDRVIGAILLHTDLDDEPLIEIPVIAGMARKRGERDQQH